MFLYVCPGVPQIDYEESERYLQHHNSLPTWFGCGGKWRSTVQNVLSIPLDAQCGSAWFTPTLASGSIATKLQPSGG